MARFGLLMLTLEWVTTLRRQMLRQGTQFTFHVCLIVQGWTTLSWFVADISPDFALAFAPHFKFITNEFTLKAGGPFKNILYAVALFAGILEKSIVNVWVLAAKLLFSE